MSSFDFLKAAWGAVLTQEAQKQIEEQCESLGRKDIEEYIKDTDIRKFGVSTDLPKDITRFVGDVPPGKFLVQVVKIADITQPARFQEEFEGGKWRLLCVEMADREQKFRGIEYGPVKSLGVHVPPGTKLLLWSTPECPLRVQNGHLLLTENNVELLGGTVEKLMESWRASREVEANRMLWRTEGIKKTDKADAAPPWVDFDPKKAPRTGGKAQLEAERAEWKSQASGVGTTTKPAARDADGGARFQVEEFVQAESAVVVKSQVSSSAFAQAPEKKGKGKGKEKRRGRGKDDDEDDDDDEPQERPRGHAAPAHQGYAATEQHGKGKGKGKGPGKGKGGSSQGQSGWQSQNGWQSQGQSQGGWQAQGGGGGGGWQSQGGQSGWQGQGKGGGWQGQGGW